MLLLNILKHNFFDLNFETQDETIKSPNNSTSITHSVGGKMCKLPPLIKLAENYRIMNNTKELSSQLFVSFAFSIIRRLRELNSNSFLQVVIQIIVIKHI